MNHKINFTMYYDGVDHEQTADMMTVREHCLLAYRCAALAVVNDTYGNVSEDFLAERANMLAMSMLALDEEDKES